MSENLVWVASTALILLTLLITRDIPIPSKVLVITLSKVMGLPDTKSPRMLPTVSKPVSIPNFSSDWVAIPAPCFNASLARCWPNALPAPPNAPPIAPTIMACPTPSMRFLPSMRLLPIWVTAPAAAPTIAPPTTAPMTPAAAALAPNAPAIAPTAPITAGPATRATTTITAIIKRIFKMPFHRGCSWAAASSAYLLMSALILSSAPRSPVSSWVTLLVIPCSRFWLVWLKAVSIPWVTWVKPAIAVSVVVWTVVLWLSWILLKVSPALWLSCWTLVVKPVPTAWASWTPPLLIVFSEVAAFCPAWVKPCSPAPKWVSSWAWTCAIAWSICPLAWAKDALKTVGSGAPIPWDWAWKFSRAACKLVAAWFIPCCKLAIAFWALPSIAVTCCWPYSVNVCNWDCSFWLKDCKVASKVFWAAWVRLVLACSIWELAVCSADVKLSKFAWCWLSRVWRDWLAICLTASKSLAFPSWAFSPCLLASSTKPCLYCLPTSRAALALALFLLSVNGPSSKLSSSPLICASYPLALFSAKALASLPIFSPAALYFGKACWYNCSILAAWLVSFSASVELALVNSPSNLVFAVVVVWVIPAFAACCWVWIWVKVACTSVCAWLRNWAIWAVMAAFCCATFVKIVALAFSAAPKTLAGTFSPKPVIVCTFVAAVAKNALAWLLEFTLCCSNTARWLPPASPLGEITILASSPSVSGSPKSIPVEANCATLALVAANSVCCVCASPWAFAVSVAICCVDGSLPTSGTTSWLLLTLCSNACASGTSVNFVLGADFSSCPFSAFSPVAPASLGNFTSSSPVLVCTFSAIGLLALLFSAAAASWVSVFGVWEGIATDAADADFFSSSSPFWEFSASTGCFSDVDEFDELLSVFVTDVEVSVVDVVDKVAWGDFVWSTSFLWITSFSSSDWFFSFSHSAQAFCISVSDSSFLETAEDFPKPFCWTIWVNSCANNSCPSLLPGL